MYCYTNYINPNWIELMIEWQRKKLILSDASDDEIGIFMSHHRFQNGKGVQSIMNFINNNGICVVITGLQIPIVKYLSK